MWYGLGANLLLHSIATGPRRASGIFIVIIIITIMIVIFNNDNIFQHKFTFGTLEEVCK